MLPDSVRRVVSLCVCSFAFFLLAVTTFAQYRAGIQGSVLDAQGDTINAATVTLTNKETGRVVTVTTDASGVFNFLSLAPGHYSISASATGFKKKDLADVTVSAEQIQSINVTMEVGDVSSIGHRQRRRHSADRHRNRSDQRHARRQRHPESPIARPRSVPVASPRARRFRRRRALQQWRQPKHSRQRRPRRHQRQQPAFSKPKIRCRSTPTASAILRTTTRSMASK